MRIALIFLAVLLAVTPVAAPKAASAQIFIGVSIGTAPPPIPYYVQPVLDDPNEIWEPGYWAWGPYGYYWVPGQWVEAPDPGLYWTPGYWAWHNGYYWQPGYWASQVGYYGGVNYGNGYYGNGYVGGSWQHDTFRYNTVVSRVDRRRIRYVYSSHYDVVNSINRVSYNGGPGGLRTRPTARQQAVAHMHHYGMTPEQRQRVEAARSDRAYLATVNHGHPAQPFVARQTPAERPTMRRPAEPQHHFAPRPAPQQHVAPQRAPEHHFAPRPAPQQHVAPQRAPEHHFAPRPAPQQHVAPRPAPQQHVAPQPHAAPHPRHSPAP